MTATFADRPRKPGASRPPKTIRQEEMNEGAPETAWRAFAAASASTIEFLVDVYLRVVYPIFPLFHRPTLLQKVRDQEYLANRGFFTSLMAACALASARGRDGAIYGSNRDATNKNVIPSETFYLAAKDSLPGDFTTPLNFNYLRACALLSITSIQYGDIKAMHLYLGHYFTLVGIHRFHDEACWPADISNIEVEERRRLYWSVYTLDIYSSIVWSGSIHTYGARAKVHYPTEVEDELILPLETLPSSNPVTPWLRGWNFTTDLYLTLEHAYNRFRASDTQIDNRIDITAIYGMRLSSSSTVLESINAYYAALPTKFKVFEPPTGNHDRDIFGFQAANIQATLFLLRMLFLRSDDDRCGPPDVQLKCNVAAELLEVFQTIPTAYLRGISTPLIYHLAGVGAILGSVMEGTLSEAAYHKVKGMLLCIADLLDRLESGLSRAANISTDLRTQVDRIDEYMRLQLRPMGRPYAQSQQDHDVPSSEHTAFSGIQMSQHVSAAGVDNRARAQWSSRGTEVEPAEAWLDGFQLPSELLEDWPWPLNGQPESWWFLGLD